MLVILIALMLIGIEAVRYQRQASLVAEYRYRLFQLRDKLREIVVRDPVARRSWVFAYLDSTTAKAISILPKVSVWRLLALACVYRDDEGYQILSTNLERELAKPQFSDLRKCEKELTAILFDFLVARHRTLHASIELVDWAITPAQKAVDDMRRRSLDVAIKSPEMSTLAEHEPEFGGVGACPVPV